MLLLRFKYNSSRNLLNLSYSLCNGAKSSYPSIKPSQNFYFFSIASIILGI